MRRCFAFLLLLAAAPAAAETRLTEEAIGPFRIVREDYRHEGPPIMHVADAWTTVRLVWRSGDGKAELQLEDNGAMLKGMFTARAAATQDSCSQIGALHAYGEGAPTGAFWRASGRQFRAFLRGCEAVERSAAVRYMEEFEAAGASFPAALERLKAVATDAFGSIARRCIRLGDLEYLSGIPSRPCVRWSGPAGRR